MAQSAKISQYYLLSKYLTFYIRHETIMAAILTYKLSHPKHATAKFENEIAAYIMKLAQILCSS